MASALAFSILLLYASSVSSSTDSPGVVHSLTASPLAPPPLADFGTTPSPRAPAIVVAISAVTPTSAIANSSVAVTERSAKSIRFSAVSGNEVDGESTLSPEDELAVAAEVGGLSDIASEKETNPLSAFKGIVSECVWALSVACMQRKLLIFVNRLSRRDRLGLLGDGVSLVRVWGDAPPAISEDILSERVSALSSIDPVGEDALVPDEEHLLDALTQRALDDLLYSHAVRLKLPSWIGSFSGARSIGAVDIDLDDVIETGRQSKKGGIKIKIKKKKKKGGGKQMMKKMMKGMAKMGGMMMTMLLGKVAILAPFLKIISALALKASALALLLSKILLVRQLFSSGFGGGSGLSSIFSGLKGGLGGGGGGGGGGAPSTGYGTPSSGYSSPSSSYNSPSSSYSSPSSSYNPPSTSYGTPSQSYRATSSGRPSSSYGVPGTSSWSSAPTAPPAPSNSYGTPSNSYSPPSKDYGAPSGGGSSWSSNGGFTSTGAGTSSGSSAGGSTGSVGGGSSSAGASSSGGYIGGGALWSNRRGWESYSVDATTETAEQYSQNS